MAARKVKPAERQVTKPPAREPVLAVPEKSALTRKMEQRDKLTGLRDQLFQESMGVLRDAMRFRDIEPGLERDLDPAFERMEQELGASEADAAYRIAKSAWMTAADAPIGLKLATNIAVGIMKANAAEKGSMHILNVSKVVVSSASVPQFEEREVESE